ncbi:MAG: glycosyltransferase [bacterium]
MSAARKPKSKSPSKAKRAPANRGRAASRSGEARAAGSAKRPLLALSMIVRNEEANLKRLLPPIAGGFDEIVVADTGSTDGTVAYLESLGVTVVHEPWSDDFAAARNASLGSVTARWVLWLDADDEIDPSAIAGLKALLANSADSVAYFLQLYNTGSNAATSSACQQLRVFPNRRGVEFEGRIHEQVVHSLARLGVRLLHAPFTVRHLGYSDPAQVRAKFERNLTLLRLERVMRPRDASLVFHVAQTLVGLERHDEAIESLGELAEMPSSDAVVNEMLIRGQLLLVRLLEARGDLAGAAATLAAASRRAPDHALVRVFVAESRRRTGDHAGVVEALQTIVFSGGLRPGILPYPIEKANEMAGLLLADALLDLRRAADAERALALALKFSEAPAERTLSFAARARALGHTETSLRSFCAAAALDPASFDAHFHAGTIHLEMGALADAHARLTSALALRPSAPEVLTNLGNLALARGDARVAESRYREALIEEPRFLLARENLAKLCLLNNRGDEALPLFLDVIKSDASRVDLLGHIGDLWLARGNPKDAIAAYERVVVAKPRAHVTWSRLGDAYALLGVPRAAEIAWTKALEIEPGYEPAKAGIARQAAAFAVS